MKLAYKKSVLLFCIGVFVVLGSSCKKYLDIENPSTISQEVAFASTSYTNTAIVGVYNLLPGDNGITKEATLWSLSADDFKTSGSYSPNDRRGISMYRSSDANNELLDAFKQLYTGVERANICIKGINTSTLYADGSASKATMGKYLGEALSLRALFYFTLVRNWGSVVAQWEPSGDLKEWDVPVTAGTEILDRLLADLKMAEDLVPWRSLSGYTSTRWTKAAIKALRARIALFRGGYMMDKESHTMVRSNEYKKYYQMALEECQEIMANRGEHNLNPSYENIFKSLHSGTRFDPTYELMFEVGAYGAGSRTDTKLGYYNGLRMHQASRFGGGGGGMTAIASYFYEFDQLGDSRRDVTIGSYEIDLNSKKVMNTLNNMTDAKFRKPWTNIYGTTQTLGVNWPVIRFADVLLMFAEADNEINGAPSILAQEALLEVRKRAFAGFESRMPVMPTDYNAFFEAIVKERLLEFGGEAVRKYDLIRWNLMGAKFAETRVKLRQLMLGEGVYVNIPLVVYSRPANYTITTSQLEFNALDNYGGSPSVTLFQPSGTAPNSSEGFATKAWRSSLNEEYISGQSTGFATFFESNKSEVFPFHQSVLLYNTRIIQNFGY